MPPLSCYPLAALRVKLATLVVFLGIAITTSSPSFANEAVAQWAGKNFAQLRQYVEFYLALRPVHAACDEGSANEQVQCRVDVDLEWGRPFAARIEQELPLYSERALQPLFASAPDEDTRTLVSELMAAVRVLKPNYEAFAARVSETSSDTAVLTYAAPARALLLENRHRDAAQLSAVRVAIELFIAGGGGWSTSNHQARTPASYYATSGQLALVCYALLRSEPSAFCSSVFGTDDLDHFLERANWFTALAAEYIPILEGEANEAERNLNADPNVYAAYGLTTEQAWHAVATNREVAKRLDIAVVRQNMLIQKLPSSTDLGLDPANFGDVSNLLSSSPNDYLAVFNPGL